MPAYEHFHNGGGVAVGNLNNDGLPDIVFVSNIGQPRIYINQGNFRFEDVCRSANGNHFREALVDVLASGTDLGGQVVKELPQVSPPSCS